jgi:hypothetical protein
MSKIVDLARLYYDDLADRRRTRREELRELREEIRTYATALSPLLIAFYGGWSSARANKDASESIAAEHETVLTFLASVQEHELKLLAEIFGPRLLPIVELMAKYASPSKEDVSSQQDVH